MTGAIPALSHRLRPVLAAICLGAAGVLVSAPVLSVPALARGPDGIADVAEKVIDAVVNISPSQTVEARTAGAVRAARAATCSRTRPTRSAPASSSILPASS